jgi:hypothetical protein
MKIILTLLVVVGVLFSSVSMAQVRPPQPWNMLAPIVFCSTYNRLVIEQTPLIQDEKIFNAFYEIEAYSILFVRQFFIEKNLVPEIELIEVTTAAGARAIEVFRHESTLDAKDMLMWNRFNQCMTTLFNTHKVLGLRGA